MSKTFTRWWVENYMGWGEIRVPSTFPCPLPHRNQHELLAEMNGKLAKGEDHERQP
jgi:hypothetical protein